jgi:hypothetical protein
VTTTSTPSTTTAPAAGPTSCTTSQLKVTTAPVSGGLNHVGIALVFTNEGPVCSLAGYPGVDGANNGIPVVAAQRTPNGYLGGLGAGSTPTTVTLATGQAASALLEGLEGGVSGQACPTYTNLLVTPPNDTQSTTVSDATICSPEIHPVVAGITGDANTPGPTPSSSTTCQPSDLQLSLDRYLRPLSNQPAAFFRLTNTSGAPCTLDGYPGFQPYDSAGAPVAVTVKRGSTFQITDPGHQLVTLAPATSAYFGVGWTEVLEPAGTAAGCATVASAASVPPNDLTPLTATADLGIFCPGSVAVTAVAPASAFTGSVTP